MGGEMCPNTNTIDGQVVVITGGAGGIGKMVCQELCYRKGNVIIAGKDTEKMEKVKTALLKNNSKAIIETRYLDLRSFDCIKRFVKDLGMPYIFYIKTFFLLIKNRLFLYANLNFHLCH